MKRYEVLWYEGPTEYAAMQDDPYTEEFKTRDEALDFYEKHKDDANKFGWWVTKRDSDWFVIEDIIV